MQCSKPNWLRIVYLLKSNSDTFAGLTWKLGWSLFATYDMRTQIEMDEEPEPERETTPTGREKET